MKPTLLDLYSGAGGASHGYALAGFDVTGVDMHHMKNYPYTFIQESVQNLTPEFISEFDVIHASPPCQAYSSTKTIWKKDHDMLIDLTRSLLKQSGKPYIIENVVGAPLYNPTMLCGTMFNLSTYRHRLFETSFALPQLNHHKHTNKTAKMGRQPKDGEFMTIAGHFTDVKRAKEIMEIDWMTRDQLSQAIPPAYTHYIGNNIH